MKTRYIICTTESQAWREWHKLCDYGIPCSGVVEDEGLWSFNFTVSDKIWHKYCKAEGVEL